MKLNKATRIVSKYIEGKQDPDEVLYTKQWDEFASLKGWWVNCTWGESNTVSFDVTKGYTRVLGNEVLDKIPDYVKGKHQDV